MRLHQERKRQPCCPEVLQVILWNARASGCSQFLQPGIHLLLVEEPGRRSLGCYNTPFTASHGPDNLPFHPHKACAPRASTPRRTWSPIDLCHCTPSLPCPPSATAHALRALGPKSDLVGTAFRGHTQLVHDVKQLLCPQTSGSGEARRVPPASTSLTREVIEELLKA